MTAPEINVVGGYTPSTGGSFLPKPTTGVAKVSDPLAFLVPPTAAAPVTQPSCDSNQSSVTTVNGAMFVTAKGGTCTIYPGVYNGVEVKANSTIDLTPGVYVFKTGNITLTGANATFNSNQALVFLACAHYPTPCAHGEQGASMSSTGSSTSFAMSPSTMGPYAGLALYSDPNNTSTISVQSAGSSMGSGTIYAKSGTVSLQSAGSALNVQSMIVANQLSTNSAGTSVTVTYSTSGNIVLPPVKASVALYQ